MRLHRRLLCACDRERLLDRDVRLGEAGLDVAVPDAKAVADVRPGLRAQAEIRGSAGGDLVRLVHERRVGPNGVKDVEDGRQLLVVD